MYRKCFKRVFDFSMSLLALIVLSPVFLIISIILIFSVGKPIMFKQYRPGKDWKVFKLYKFKSMVDKYDEDGNLLPDEDRITKFGKFLRKTSLDELPQLWNILKGDMSIVGPRPRLVKDMVFYRDDVLSTYSVRPGLTGLSQVNGRNDNTWEEIFEWDKKYIEKITFWRDIKIIFKTVFSIFKSKGAESGSGDKSDYYYGNYLLNRNQITPEEFEEGQKDAKLIIEKKLPIKKFIEDKKKETTEEEVG